MNGYPSTSVGALRAAYRSLGHWFAVVIRAKVIATREAAERLRAEAARLPWRYAPRRLELLRRAYRLEASMRGLPEQARKLRDHVLS